MGKRGLEQNREGFTRKLWQLWSPTWDFSEAEFAATRSSFDNSDWILTTLHCYRHWYAHAAGDPVLQKFEDALAAKPKILAPTMVLHGDSDSLYPISASAGQEHLFTRAYHRRILKGTGTVPRKRILRNSARESSICFGLYNQRTPGSYLLRLFAT
jgi:hypothetical protein